MANLPSKSDRDYSEDGDYAEIIEFTGEILSIEMDGRGGTVLNDGVNTEQVFHRVDGEVYTDTYDLESA